MQVFRWRASIVRRAFFKKLPLYSDTFEKALTVNIVM